MRVPKPRVGSPLLKETAYYVSASLPPTFGLPPHFAFRYPASLAGHAFGFNAHGLTLSMNSLTPTAIDSSGVGCYFLCHSALSMPTVDAVVQLFRSRRSAFGGSLNVASTQTAGHSGANLEFAPGLGANIAVTPMPRSPIAAASFHMNEYLHLRGVSFRKDASSEHRLARAMTLIAQVPARAANLSSLWRVLGDTADTAYPLYRKFTAATATFALADEQPTLYVHEGGNPLSQATRRVQFALPRAKAPCAEGPCPWPAFSFGL